MPRRKGQDAERAIQKERWNRWRILLRRPDFQRDLNRLRRAYREWVEGAPITYYTYEWDHPVVVLDVGEIPQEIEGKISRKDVDLYEHHCDVNDTIVGVEGAWGNFNLKWDVRLPKAALAESLRNLSPLTIQDWDFLEDVRTLVPPSIQVAADHWSVPIAPHTLTLTLDLGYPRDVLLEQVNQEIQKEMQRRASPETKGSVPFQRQRRRHDKLTFQLRVYDLYESGETTWRIARTLRRSHGTVKSALTAATKLIRGERPRHGKAWWTHHLKTCPKCRSSGKLNLNCPEAEKRYHAWLDAIVAASEECNKGYIPPLPVKGEKSALSTWKRR